jgi:ABC-2 type transport system ATP-binding protein
MIDPAPIIEVEDLCRRFGPVEAVRGVTFAIPKGELFCFLGPNGAGKTTTIKMLCGLLRPTSGRARIMGLDVAGRPLEIRRATGYIPDTPFLYERLTVEEFFRFVGDLYQMAPGQVDRRAEESFELFGLGDARNALIKDLSHGMRQRLVYASCLLHDPEVLFVDEPFVGLDPSSIRLIKDLLKEKSRQGMTVFLTTHILALAEEMADRVGIIHNGRMAAFGTLNELRQARQGLERLEDIFLNVTGGDGDAPRK